MILHQAAHNLASGEIICTVMDVIPHHKLGEGEDPKAGRFQNVPTFLIHDPMANRGKDTTGMKSAQPRRWRSQG